MTFNQLRSAGTRVLMGVPVGAKVMGIVLGVVVLLGAGMLWSIHATWHGALRRDVQERARALAGELAVHCANDVVGGRVAELESRLEDATALNRGVEYLLVVDRQGRVLAHTLPGSPSEELLRANGLGTGASPRLVVLDTPRGWIHDVAAPILGGNGGIFRVGMNEERIARDVAWLTRRLAIMTATIAAIGLMAAWGFTRFLTSPVRELVDATRSVREGRLDVEVPVRARDEFGELAAAFNEMTASLGEKEHQRQHLLRKVMGIAEDERKHLARELHDETGQALTSVIAGLGALETTESPGTTRDRLAALRVLAEKTLQGVQEVSRALRPSVLDDLGLDAALQRQAETLGRALGVAVEVQSVGWDGKSRLSPEIELAVYRIVQEALTNAVRHGRADSIHALVQRMPAKIIVVVEDDGVGFNASAWRSAPRHAGHLGLVGIEERAALFGGNVRVESAPGSGTSVFIELPLIGVS